MESAQNDVDKNTDDISQLNSALADKVSKSGDTMTGKLTFNTTTANAIEVNQKNENTAATVKATAGWNDGIAVSLQVGNGGTNRGIYDEANNRWMMYTDSSDNVHLGTSTIGSGTKPIYLSSGVPTASSSTVGSSSKPVYLSSGTLTACSMSNVFSISTVSTDNITISASSNYSYSISASKSGYTPIAVTGYSISNASSSGTMSSWCNCFGYWLANSIAYANIRNTSTSTDAKVQIQLWVLYVES